MIMIALTLKVNQTRNIPFCCAHLLWVFIIVPIKAEWANQQKMKNKKNKRNVQLFLTACNAQCVYERGSHQLVGLTLEQSVPERER